MAKGPGEIDYSKWNNLDLSSSGEEEEAGAIATAPAAATTNTNTAYPAGSIILVSQRGSNHNVGPDTADHS